MLVGPGPGRPDAYGREATVDKSANVVGADLDRHTNKAAVAAIAMPSLTDGGSRFMHDHSILGP
jgi:hypothetical protein